MSSARESPKPVPVEERLFSLVLALLATQTGLTKNEILSTVQGYRQQYSSGGGNASLERQFERDKDNIRELGVPLETIEQPGEPGNNQSMRYRIPKGAYELPTDVRFTPAELSLLSLAATVWREGSLSGQSQRAMTKLRSLGIEPDEPIIGYAPRLRTREASFEPLDAALERRSVATFPYLKPGEARPRVRTVAPLALVQHEGRWHLYATDRTVDEPRTFLLSRIVGPVKPTGESFPADARDHAADAIDGLRRVSSSQRALVRVRPGTDAAARLGNRYGVSDTERTELTIPYLDHHILADELAGFGPEVVVLDPPALVEAVASRLELVVARHRSTDDAPHPEETARG
ncbi:helix-turn-helix transcriptional regulator [Plantibacter sp. CFBP 13570]|uniref:helix-turn-helix transcriptional regulator n=1 Tax=Plantibacter sp. CFBP 13570 TaxID=2775272 RepID=UPI001930DD2D|nr:WYL domain-containing protein [Plantibacter sp. CFBP 13570]MBD8534504.1 WYL domain-containing protein [Plantibacter sp. CFBP 13570]